MSQIVNISRKYLFVKSIYGYFLVFYKYDGFVKSPKTPSPLMGEGGGEGDKHLYFSHFASPSPLSPPAKGGEM
jgi:hypothetical protein